jgi:Cellulase (glycosyl hydrolase family 5)
MNPLRISHRFCSFAGGAALIAAIGAVSAAAGKDLERVHVAADGHGFVLVASGQKFSPWGFNYDHDERGRLIEDYWETEWPKIEADFREMRELGANVVRVHLQLGKFLKGPDRTNDDHLARLAKLVELAQHERLYLDLTGLGCYHKADVPPWYDKLTEAERWQSQARFWSAVAARCAGHAAVFCYDLMNEPVVAAGKREGNDWLGGAFAGKHFVQFITLDSADRPREDIARKWIGQLSAAIRKRDPDALVTVGLVDWSLDRPRKLYSGFAPAKIAADLDFLCVHVYPERGKVDDALATLRAFSVGKPLVIEETFPLKCGPGDFDRFFAGSKLSAAGWVGFYWGKTVDECRASNEIGDKIMLSWLEWFKQNRPGKSQ